MPTRREEVPAPPEQTFRVVVSFEESGSHGVVHLSKSRLDINDNYTKGVGLIEWGHKVVGWHEGDGVRLCRRRISADKDSGQSGLAR